MSQDVLSRLAATIKSRRSARPEDSHTRRLLDEAPVKPAKKLGEEAVEVSELSLTDREHQVLELMALGRDTQAMASEMGVAEATVRTHVKHLFTRLGVHSRAEAVAVGLREGLIT